MSKNRISNLRSNSTLARLSAKIFRKQASRPRNVFIMSQKTRFGLNNLFGNYCGYMKDDFRTFAFATNILPLFKCISCIHYPIQFQKNQAKVQILIDFRSKINAMILAYVSKLSFIVQATNIKAQKIDGFIFQNISNCYGKFPN